MKLFVACALCAVFGLTVSAHAQSPKPSIRAEAKRAGYDLDTPIKDMAADPKAKAILDKELPGLTTHPKYGLFKGMSLKALQPLSGGLITDERLKATETSLKALAG